MRANLSDPHRQCLRPVEPEDLPAFGIRIQRVREPRLDAGRLVGEGERAFYPGREFVREAVDVLRRLPGDARERLTLLLGFGHSDRLAVDKEQVVRSPMRRLEYELAH